RPPLSSLRSGPGRSPRGPQSLSSPLSHSWVARSGGFAGGTGGGAARVADVRRTAVILGLLFLPAELGLQLVQGQVDRHLQFAVCLAGDEIVFVLRGYQDFDGLLVLSHVYRNLDHRQPVKEVQKLVGFLTDHLLSGVAQVAVASGD